MRPIHSVPSARASRALARTVLCCALVLATTAQARSLDMQPPLRDPPADIVAPASGTRSLFVATIVTMIAQGLGNSLSHVIGGSITRWFSGGPKRAESGAKPIHASAAKSDAGDPAVLHAGVAYEVHLIGTGGSDRAVDPARHAFHTGDRFQIYYRPTLPGRIKVFNVDPKGSESRIDGVEVAAGQLAALGPYQFVGAKGEEMLKLVLEPCSSTRLTAATRAIVKIGAASAAADPSVRIADCGDPRRPEMDAKPRTISKIAIDGATAFALDPLSREELKSGRVGTREVRIALHHR